MNTIIERFQLMLNDTLSSTTDKVWGLLPEILFAIVVIFVGWLAAVLVHHIVLWVLNFFAVDKLAAKTPLQSILKSVGIQKSVSEILGLLVFWLVLLLTLVIAADSLHLEQVSEGLAMITGYIPQVIASILIIVFGMLLAKFLQMVVSQGLSRMDIAYTKFVGKAVQIVVLLFVFIAAVDQLGIDLDYVLNGMITFFSVLLLMLGLGAAIGARTVLDNAVACQQVKRQLPLGSSVKIDGMNGRVIDYTLTSVVLDVDDTETVLPATHLLTHKYTQS